MVMELLSYDAPRSDHDPELAQAEASDVARHPVTGAFENESHESAFRAQIFRSAFTGHALLMTLSLAVYIWVALVAPPDLRVFWTTIALITTFFTVGRVLLHHMEDTQRGQRVSSWAWTGFLIPISIAVIYVYMVNTASTCSLVQLEYFAPLTSFATALINGSHGLGFVHKMSLVGLLLVTDLVLVTVCGELALALALCNIGALVVGSAAAHMVEVYLRHSYAEKVQDMRRVTEEKRRLEERNEQLQTSNERLLYDMQLRARSSSNPNLDEDDRSAIRRGLQAGASQPHQPAGDADSSEAGGPAPSGTPPPSLPPGAPSSTTSGPSDSPLPSLPRGAPSSTAGSSTAPPPLTETDGDPERRAESAARPAVVQHGAAAQRTWRRGDRARRAQRLAESANVVGLVAAPRPPCSSRAVVLTAPSPLAAPTVLEFCRKQRLLLPASLNHSESEKPMSHMWNALSVPLPWAAGARKLSGVIPQAPPSATPANAAACTLAVDVQQAALQHAGASSAPPSAPPKKAPPKRAAPPESASAPSAKRTFSNPYHAFCQDQRPHLPLGMTNRDREKLLGVLAPYP